LLILDRIVFKGFLLLFIMETCKTPWQLARGLMFSKKNSLRFVLPKKQIVHLHTLFVFFPIEIMFYDGDTVVERTTMKPFRFYHTKVKVTSFIEKHIEILK